MGQGSHLQKKGLFQAGSRFRLAGRQRFILQMIIRTLRIDSLKVALLGTVEVVIKPSFAILGAKDSMWGLLFLFLTGIYLKEEVLDPRVILCLTS